MENLKALSKALQLLKDHKFQSRLLYPTKLSVIAEGEREPFHHTNGLKEFMFNKTVLYTILEVILRQKRGIIKPCDYRKTTNESTFTPYPHQNG